MGYGVTPTPTPKEVLRLAEQLRQPQMAAGILK